MPKKTKREKLLADHRRVQMVSTHEPPFQFQAQAPVPVIIPPVLHETSGDLVLIRKDLYKTVVLATIAIFSEVLLAKIIR